MTPVRFALLSFRLAVPRLLVPSKNVTVPVAEPPLTGVTVAERVMGC